jgi:Flp pilus assembly protein TadB
MPRRPALLGVLAVLSVLVMAYSLIIARQILLGVLLVAAVWLFYLCYLTLRRLGRIASALERIADNMDAGSERGDDEF